MARYKRATMSILGLYFQDPDLFSGMVYPDELDKDILIDSILSECAEMEIIYPDPEYMKNLITLWSKKELYNWRKLYETTQFVYNPIWNVDGTVTETETRNLQNRYQQNEGANNKNVNAKTGYNSGAFEDAEQDTGRTDIERGGESADTGSVTRETKRGGNIGVTMTQQMIEAEREVDKFNIYDFIVDSFKRRFCILVY